MLEEEVDVMDDYMLRFLAKQRVAEIQAFLYKQAVARSLKPPRRPLLAILGMSLIRLGRLILRHVPAWVDARSRPRARPVSRTHRRA